MNKLTSIIFLHHIVVNYKQITDTEIQAWENLRPIDFFVYLINASEI